MNAQPSHGRFYERMQPLSKAWYYYVMCVLVIVQACLMINYHVMVCNIPIANTILLTVIMAHHGYVMGDEAKPLYYRICGCVAFLAVLFVGTTHALESLSDFGGGGHSHGHGEHLEDGVNGTDVGLNMNATDSDVEILLTHDEGSHGYGFIPLYSFYISVFDLLLKITLLVLGHVPAMGLSVIPRVVLHTLSPVVIIGYFLIGKTVSEGFGDSWLWKHLDPITAVAMTVLFVSLIIPAFKEMKPYIFADTPEDLQVEVFKGEISTQFTDVTCSHMHAYCLWPGNIFEALIHLDFKVDKSSPNWSSAAATRYEEVRQSCQSALTRAGARKVVVEPRFVDVNASAQPWVGCVQDTCFRQDKGCCKNEGPANNQAGTP